MNDDPADTLRRQAPARGWHPTEADGTWYATSPDGSERATVRAVPGGFDVRVVRYQTGESPGPDPEPSHGPQFFSGCDDALAFGESNLGADDATPTTGSRP